MKFGMDIGIDPKLLIFYISRSKVKVIKMGKYVFMSDFSPLEGGMDQVETE